jgi:hypothetical protein
MPRHVPSTAGPIGKTKKMTTKLLTVNHHFVTFRRLLKKPLIQAVQKLVPYRIRDVRMQGPRNPEP